MRHVLLAALLLFQFRTDAAYRVIARENSFLGTSSSTDPAVTWTRVNANTNGASSAQVYTSGAAGLLQGLMELRRFGASESPSDTVRKFESYIEEQIIPAESVPPNAILRLTMDIHASGGGVIGQDNGGSSLDDPPVGPFRGYGRLDLDARLGLNGSAMLIAGSRMFVGEGWTSFTNLSSGLRTDVQTRNGHISRITLEVRRPQNNFTFFYAAQVLGEARGGAFPGAVAIVQGRMHVNFLVEVSSDEGASFVPVRWTSSNSKFLAEAPPWVSFPPVGPAVPPAPLTSKIMLQGLPFTTNQVQFAPSPAGPWQDFGSPVELQNLDPVEISDPNPGDLRFYRAVRLP